MKPWYTLILLGNLHRILQRFWPTWPWRRPGLKGENITHEKDGRKLTTLNHFCCAFGFGFSAIFRQWNSLDNSKISNSSFNQCFCFENSCFKVENCWGERRNYFVFLRSNSRTNEMARKFKWLYLNCKCKKLTVIQMQKQTCKKFEELQPSNKR